MIVYSEHFIGPLIFQARGSVIHKALWYVIPSVALTWVLLLWEDIFPDFDKPDVLELNNTVVWSLSTGATFALLTLRLRQAHSRFWEGTTLLHQMQGEWFESASCLLAFSARAKLTKPEEVRIFRQTLIRLMSFLHGAALEEIKRDSEVSYGVLDVWGLDKKCIEILKENKNLYGFDRVQVLLHLIQNLMTAGFHSKILSIDAPILSRVYQTLSRGMVNFLNAEKITDTMFPFPFAQLCAIFILFHTLFTPFFIVSLITNKTFATIGTIVPVFGICCLNFTAEEIEMPYGDDPNDLPLEEMQKSFNSGLLMLLRETSDHVPQVPLSRRKPWAELFQSVVEEEEVSQGGCCGQRCGRQSRNTVHPGHPGRSPGKHFEDKVLGHNTSYRSDDLALLSRRSISRKQQQQQGLAPDDVVVQTGP